MINHLDEVIDFTTKNKLYFINALIKLTTNEIDYKKANMAKVGVFPHNKEIKDFDFQPSVDINQILDFASLRFLESNENIVFLGSSGVGKTHLATSIGIAAAKRRYSTYFIKCNDLLQQLKRANLENRLKHFSKYKLLIIDELGYLPRDKEDSTLFFQLMTLSLLMLFYIEFFIKF